MKGASTNPVRVDKASGSSLHPSATVWRDGGTAASRDLGRRLQQSSASQQRQPVGYAAVDVGRTAYGQDGCPNPECQSPGGISRPCRPLAAVDWLPPRRGHVRWVPSGSAPSGVADGHVPLPSERCQDELAIPCPAGIAALARTAPKMQPAWASIALILRSVWATATIGFNAVQLIGWWWSASCLKARAKLPGTPPTSVGAGRPMPPRRSGRMGKAPCALLLRTPDAREATIRLTIRRSYCATIGYRCELGRVPMTRSARQEATSSTALAVHRDSGGPYGGFM